MAAPLLIPAGVLAWLGGWFTTAIAKTIVDRILFFLALKILLTFLFIVALPLVLNNLIYDLLEIGSNYMISAAETPAELDGAMQFTGLMAWLIDCFKIPECIAICVSALQFRLVLSNIPFVGLRS